MASAILHIKDAYYFDVPRSLWPHHFVSLDEVPAFLREGHPEATLTDFNRELAGKILIPQPFGTLQNLYEKKSGFCISKFMIIEVVVALLLAWVMVYVGARIRSGTTPHGRLVNFIEAILLFLRDQVVRPAIGPDHDAHDSHGHGAVAQGAVALAEHGHGSHAHGREKPAPVVHHGPTYKEADSFVPLLWTMFFFVLTCNLFGLLPWAGSPTGSFAVTLALAAITFIAVLVSGARKFGPIGFWLNQVPHMDLPWYMSPIKALIWVIEVVGLLIRHGVLAVRLLANMVAGHLVLLAILGLAVGFEGAISAGWFVTAGISVFGSVCFSVLELFVAFLQAYVFVFLSALFIGSAVHSH